MRLRTSAQWANSFGGNACDNCKGFGHTKANCPSPGGAKHVPPNKDIKGCKAKGKGNQGSCCSSKPRDIPKPTGPLGTSKEQL